MGVLDKPLTPCVGICSTTSQGDAICIGCKRTARQVLEWNTYPDAKKIKIMNNLKADKAPRCKYCHSEDIHLEGYGLWSMDEQKWIYQEGGWYPNAYCVDCSDNTKLEWITV